MKINENQCKSMKILEKSIKIMKIHENHEYREFTMNTVKIP